MEINKKLANRSLIASFVLAWSILILVMLYGCSSKQKALTETKVEIKKETTLYSVGSSKSKSELQSEANTKAQEIEKVQETEYEGAVGDSLTVTEKDGEGKVLKETTYKGKGKLKSKSSEKTKTTDSQEKKSETKQDAIQVSLKKKAAEEKKEADKKLNVNREGISFGFKLWLLVAVIIGGLVFYLNNRFKWVSYVTSFFKSK